MAELYQAGSSYSTLNTARSALSITFVVSDSDTFGRHPLVSRFMKGVFETRPSLPRYGETWDVNLMLNYLSSLGPPEKQGPVVRNVDSAIHWIVIFSTAVKRHVRQWPIGYLTHN